jgi:uncharacterized protein YbjT (DUF2867 family)
MPDVQERWVQGVEWIEADVFEPADWSTALEDAEAVIDCIGRATGAAASALGAPMSASATIVADLSEAANVQSVVYISCARETPGLEGTEFEARAEAEAVFGERSYVTSVLRPTQLSGHEDAAPALASPLGDPFAEGSLDESSAGDRPAIRRETVAICALRAALEPNIRGILEIEEIAHLGDAMFIQ